MEIIAQLLPFSQDYGLLCNQSLRARHYGITEIEEEYNMLIEKKKKPI